MSKIIPEHDTVTRKPESTKATSLQAQINYVCLCSTLLLCVQQYMARDEPPQLHIKPLLLTSCSLENGEREITHTQIIHENPEADKGASEARVL